MKPKRSSLALLGITRSRAKMFEYSVPPEHHISIKSDPAILFRLSIGILGDTASELCRSWNETPNEALLGENRKTLVFSASFFDAYLSSRLDEEIDNYLILLAACAYYLCDLPGSSSVLLRRLEQEKIQVDASGLEQMAISILADDDSDSFPSGSRYSSHFRAISESLRQHYLVGADTGPLETIVDDLRTTAYQQGTPRELLLADVLGAIIRKKLENSLWTCLPKYSRLPPADWRTFIELGNIRELWPAQHTLGKSGVLTGCSAVIQMPTSAGKTRATELIIRSAFLSGRATIALLVAPFRSLCNEVKLSLGQSFRNDAVFVEEFSDVFQADFNVEDFSDAQFVVILTPEKLLYALRQSPSFAGLPGLVIFDEAHQFDSEKRGTTYELLMTTLKLTLPAHCQKILISAVISNGEAVGQWFNGPGGSVADGTKLTPTLRTVGFAEWERDLGQIRYPEGENMNPYEFYVPRVIEPMKLGSKSFPDKTTNSIAAYLGLKLMVNGSVAIFCGVKSTAAVVIRLLVNAYGAGLSLQRPSQLCNQEELSRLVYLYEKNLGASAEATKGAALGVFAHHADTPHGLKLAVEQAMRDSLIRFVVCTSTLAQGVNLPLRYVIVTSLYQGQQLMTVRDFHNLIGRAGRAGMYTEGTVIFADLQAISDKGKANYRWRTHERLMKGDNLEPCLSNLLRVFETVKVSVKRANRNVPLESQSDFPEVYIQHMDEDREIYNYYQREFSQLSHQGDGSFEDALEREISARVAIMHSVESFLMANWDVAAESAFQEDTIRLARGTLAYSIAAVDQRERVPTLFLKLAQKISETIRHDRRRVYGRTLLGLVDSSRIDLWTTTDEESLARCKDDPGLVRVLWGLLPQELIEVGKCSDEDFLEEALLQWLGGAPFWKIHENLQKVGAKRAWGKSNYRDYTLEQVVSLCEREFSFNGSHLLGAVIDMLALRQSYIVSQLSASLRRLQKRLRYGLDTGGAVALYELGFADRVVATDLAVTLNIVAGGKEEARTLVLQRFSAAQRVVKKYPTFYHRVLETLKQ